MYGEYDHELWKLQQRQRELYAQLFQSPLKDHYEVTPWQQDPLPIRPPSQWRQSDEPLVSKGVAGYLAEWFAL